MAGAVLDLVWARVDLEHRRLDLNPTGRPATRKGRAVVPINDTLYAALIEAKEGALTDHVIEWGGRPVKSVRKAFARAGAKAGVEPCSPHTLRHTAAVWMAEAGVPMPEIAQMLGHSDDRTTQRVYARYGPDYLRTAAKALEG